MIPTFCYLFHHPSLSGRSGMAPLVEALGAEPVYYNVAWELLQSRSWRLGQLVRTWGQRWSGSEWFAPWPIWDEWRLIRKLPKNAPSIAHYVFADFTPPMYTRAAQKRGARVVATFHVSARRAPQVLAGVRRLDQLDAVTLVSASQREWFLNRGVAEDRLHVLLHGVDSVYFSPAVQSSRESRLRLLLVGKTERDHRFAASVMNRLPKGVAQLRALTSREQQAEYLHAQNVHVLPRMDDSALLNEYQQADLLFMPMLDCTANNAVLESMACGTPVMVNRVGGIPEYVNPSCNVVMDEKRVDAWVEKLIELSRSRDALESKRSAVRTWAEGFAWPLVARQYLDLFERLCK